MIVFACLTFALAGFWFGSLWGYAVCYREWVRTTATMSEPDPRILTFTRSTTLSRGHR